VIQDNTRIAPTKWLVNEGDTVQFYCNSKFAVKWLFNDEEIPSNAYISDNNITVTNLTIHNSGFYTCKSFDNGSVFHAEGRVDVKGGKTTKYKYNYLFFEPN